MVRAVSWPGIGLQGTRDLLIPSISPESRTVITDDPESVRAICAFATFAPRPVSFFDGDGASCDFPNVGHVTGGVSSIDDGYTANRRGMSIDYVLLVFVCI